MPHDKPARSVFVYVSTLILLFASLPPGLGQAGLQPVGPVLTNLNVAQIQFSGRLVCSPSGNLPPGSGSLGAAGTLVSGACNGASGDLGTAVTNSTGFFLGVISLPINILFNVSGELPCFITVKLPATGTSCTLFPPSGILQAAVQLLSLIVNAAGELVVTVTTRPFQYVP